LCDYIEGSLQCPNKTTDPVGTSNWKFNDNYTRKVIRDHMSASQKYHITHCKTAQEMWAALKGIHQTCGDQTENYLLCELTDSKAGKGDDIIEHLANIKQLWDCIVLVAPNNIPSMPAQFKKFLSFSLLPSSSAKPEFLNLNFIVRHSTSIVNLKFVDAIALYSCS